MILIYILTILVILPVTLYYYVNRDSRKPERDHEENNLEDFPLFIFLSGLISLAIYIVSYNL